MATSGWQHVKASDIRQRRIVVDKPSKYHAEKVTLDGFTFDSKAEAKRYGELKALERAGEIRSLRVKPPFDLSVLGAVIGTYVADFSYTATASDTLVVEDVKGAKTLPLARWKMKHLQAQYGITVREIR